ncbi:CBO0543 family protein [Lederbergia lenta]|uniref:CBO0543 family protein n=1 Tax=Lederbergia lenta TaxID=1467 RepID=UPI0011AE55FC|nr:CBO0543 family protein [Lederbergia lenta]
MNTVKRLRSWRLLLLQKKQSFYNTVYAALFAALLGTYLDLYFVGRNMYEFPIRPFPDVFSINIAFTLLILPCFTMLFLMAMRKMNRRNRSVFIIFLSLMVFTVENKMEQWGFFYHSNEWKHYYSFYGYFLFFVIIWSVYKGNGTNIIK